MFRPKLLIFSLIILSLVACSGKKREFIELPFEMDFIPEAIDAFERTLVTPETRFDQYMRGDKSAISISEENGFHLFKKVGCGNCHNGSMFSDYLPHPLGVPPNPKLPAFDKGKEEQYAYNSQFEKPTFHCSLYA